MQLPELLDRAVSLLYPQRCMRCDDLVEYDDLFCGRCFRHTSVRAEPPFAHGLAGLGAIYEYKGRGRRLVWEIKAGAPKRVCYILGYDMHTLLRELWGEVEFDMIVPVPATQTRLEAQGFNHAELLAQPLSRLAGIPIRPDTLVRAESTLTQRYLNRENRKENAERSYQAGRVEELSGKTILLVDDLLTTGWTLTACAGRLLGAGAAKVYGLTAAATPFR